MKKKSTSANKFRYVSFSEQIAKVSVDIARWHSSLAGAAAPAGAGTSTVTETYFNDAIAKYKDLDYGSYFESFLNDIPYSSGELRTYAQLLHRKDVIARALIKHLNIVESTSVGTLLQLTVAFAQDLREDLQSYLWEFMKTIIDLLERSHQDPEILEAGFFTLAKIFWLQRRRLVRELREVFRRFRILFSSKRAYVRRFIAEAIAFLLRKSNSLDKLTVYLAETAYKEANNSLIDSISQLYFNALKVTKRQFHSMAPQVLLEILKASLGIEEKNIREIAIQILEGTMRHCANYTSKEYSGLLLDIILEQYKSAALSSNIANISALAKLLIAWISQKSGKSVHNPAILFETLIDGLKNTSEKQLNNETVMLLGDAIVRYHCDSEFHTLITAAVRAVQDSSSRDDFDLILNFINELSDIALFDLWIMPIVGTFMSRFIVEKNIEMDRKIFKFYADLCSRRRPLWADVGHERQHPFFDPSNHLEVRKRLIEILKSSDEYDAGIVGCCLMAYPWLWRRSENPEEIEAVSRILETSMNTPNGADARLAFLAANICAVFNSGAFGRFTLDTFLKSYKIMGSTEAALHVLTLALPYIKDSEQLSSVSAMGKVATEILPMFSHWSSNVRQIALEILSSFNVPLNNIENDDGTITNVANAFDLLLKAERTPWTLEDYRTRLMILRQLTYGAHVKHMPCGCDIVLETIPLRVIIANLHEPFTIAWNELKSIIQDYAYGLNIDTFFTLFFGFIEHATNKITSNSIDNVMGNDILDKLTTVTETYLPDYGTFRLELFTILGRISDLAERRTKLLSPVFISFFRNEYQRGNPLERRENILLPASDLSSIKVVAVNDGNSGNDDDDDDDDDENNGDNTNNDTDLFESRKLEEMDEARTEKNSKDENTAATDGGDGNSIGRKLVKRTLITFLEIFGSFRAPKTIYLAKEIRDLYNELLMTGDQILQQLAMKCIFTYKYKYVTPYKEYLENMMVERTFVNGLTMFCVDKQNSIVDSNHRTDLMPIVLRFLYGKCSIRQPRDSTDRRGAIFRFLAGCVPDELNFFLTLLFGPLLKIIGEKDDETLHTLCTRIISTFDASSMIPLAIIKGTCRSISLMATKLSPALTNQQRHLLFRVCLAAGLLSRLAIQNLPLVQPRYVKQLKELRRLACSTFKEIFHAYQNHQFEVDELGSFLKYFIAPMCIHQNDTTEIPLSLLRLFLSWTSVPKQFYLLRLQVPLDDHCGGTMKVSVFSLLCTMLSSNTISETVKGTIIDGILNLLTLADEEVPAPSLVDADLDQVEIRKAPELNIGTAMVLLELPTLLTFIYRSLPSEGPNRKLNMKHLEVLNRISEFVEDAEMSERFVSTLLTFLESGAVRSDDAVQSLLLTVSRMITVTTKPTQFLRNLINLQSSLIERSLREALQQVENSVALKLKDSVNEAEKKISDLLSCVVSLDSWDGRRIGEPDYDARHEAYSSLNKALAIDGPIEPVLLFLVLHNDYYVITELNDISLRSAAVANFRSITEYVGKRSDFNEHEKEETIDHILRLILKGLHQQKETVRHDFVNLLVAVITVFPEHKQLRHLVPLRNTVEVDLDFFENVTHLQIHRRQRAFSRLTHSLQTGEIHIPNEVLLLFMVPLLQPYIVELSSSTSTLSDAALALLTQIMRGAPWKKYFPMLDFYLKRLRKENVNHKAIVRVIVAIVDAFHFDVSDATEAETNDDEQPVRKRRKVNPEIVGLEGTRNKDDNDGAHMEIDNTVAEEEMVDLENTVAVGTRKSTASTVRQKVLEYLIPRLKDCATGKDLTSHRKAQSGKYYKEDDDIQRAPVALATVKLLQKMPQTIMDQHLHGVIIKMCSLLMSRSIGVREAAGRTIIEIAKTLGPKYLRFVIREMKQIMKQGYQVHVMIFYVHKLLSAMEEQLGAGDLDSCLMDVVEVCNMDLFDDAAEEKTITGITKDVPEAKAQRAYETYRLLGHYISSECLGNILTVLKKAVESAPNAKTVKKVGRLLRQYSLGIAANGGIEPVVVLVFTYQILKKHMAEIQNETKSFGDTVAETSKKKEGQRPESCLLLEKEPTRIGVIVKVSMKSKMHVFVEFGFAVLFSTLKKKTFDPESNDDVARLDPFVDIVLHSLQLKYDQILINSLRCFLLLLRFPLPALRSRMPQFLNRLFILLADYAALGGAPGSGQDYVRKSVEVSQLIFKAFTQIIKDAPDLVLTSKRLQLLLTYIETDVIDNQKQAVAFPLIKAIIIRKLQDPKIVEIIQYLSETAIISEISHIREQCRQVMALYIGTHPQCKKPAKHVEFFLEQLEYEYEDGRKSAIEMLNLFFEKLTEAVNDQYALLAFVKLSARLVNDESQECRKMVALAIQQLVKSVSESKRNDLYLAARDWLESGKEIHLCIAIQLMVIIGKLRGEKFENTLREELLPILSKIIHADILSSYAEESIGIILDNLTLILSGQKNRMTEFMKDELLDSVLREMGAFARCHESSIVQLAAARFLGLIFSTVDPECLMLRNDPSAREFAQWTLAQLKTYQLSNELAEQAVKNLVYLFDAAIRTDDDLKWLCHRLSMLCKFEVVKLPNEAVRRINVFKAVVVIILKIEPYRCMNVLNEVLPSLYREMLGKSAQNTEELQQTAKEVADTIKRKIGEEEFLKRISECQRLSAAKFEERKRAKKEEAVRDPITAARKKMRKNKAKCGVQKRKILRKKGHKTVQK